MPTASELTKLKTLKDIYDPKHDLYEECELAVDCLNIVNADNVVEVVPVLEVSENGPRWVRWLKTFLGPY